MTREHISNGMEEMAQSSHLLLAASNATDRPIVICDNQRRIVYVNRAFTGMLGYGPEDVIGQDPSVFTPDLSLSEPELKRLRSLPWGRERIYEKVFVRCKDGREVWIQVSSSPFPEDAPSGMHGYSLDVLYDITREQQIRDLERDALEALTSGLPFEELGVYLCRRIQAIVSGALVSLCRVADRRLRPWAAPDFPAIYNASLDGAEIGEGAASCGTAAHRGDPVMVYDIDTDRLWAPYKHVVTHAGLRACWSYPIKRRDGTVVGTFAFFFKRNTERDPILERIAVACVHLCSLAIELEERRQKISDLMQLDTLTGLPNLNFLRDRIDRLLSRDESQPLNLLHIDIDRMIDVNTALGIIHGDHAILMMMNRLKESCGEWDIFCRLDGDAFALLMPNCNIYHAVVVADRLVNAARCPFHLDGSLLQLSVSIGIAQCSGPADAGTRDLLLANARAATQRAKQQGGNTYQFFRSDFNESARDRVLLGAALRRALDRNGLALNYQPQIDADGELYGVEALARWRDEELGVVPPGRFIPLAEEIGLIEAIGRWALHEACRQMAEWRKAGVHVPVVSVNLSAVSFRKPDLPEYVAAVLSEFAVSGASLTIEITESTAMDLTGHMLHVIKRLRGLGVGLSIDDFGTGFSNLSNLMNLPVVEVKIDRTFIRKAMEQHQYRSIITAVIDIGHALGLHIVAEGVETQAEMDLICAQGGVVIQGYYYAPPLEPAALGIWIETRRPGQQPRQVTPPPPAAVPN